MKSLEQFRAEALGLMRQHLAPKADGVGSAWGVGSDDVSIFSERQGEEELAELRRARAWQALKYDHGFGWLTGPKEYGGAELPPEYAAAFAELEDGYVLPDNVYFSVGHGMIGPTLLRVGTPEAKARYLREIYRGDVVCCQLFSEPEAGSDLAAVRTMAVLDGDEWVVNGQKVWTSQAHYADLGLLLARTDPDGAKHRSLTMFLLPMDTPGIDVRPIRQITGGEHFDEVFLSDVRIPDALRLGPIDEGWAVAMGTLSSERASMHPGGANAGLANVPLEHVLGLVRHAGLAEDALVRQQVAQLYILRRIFEFNAMRLRDDDDPGGTPICKLSSAHVARATARLAADVLGPKLTADTGEWGTFAWNAYILGVPAMRLGGGTDEIQRNIIAERALGLPREAKGL